MDLSAEKAAARRIVPILAACLFINIVDRANVGIAALRMAPDIGLSAAAYGLGAGIFYIGYCLFEVPSNILLHRFGARRWIFRIMISWGATSALMGFVYDEWSFYALRFLLGVTEAGFFPGMIFYLSQWFDRRARAWVTGILFAVMPASFVISAPISTALLMELGWRSLFVFEAVPAVLLAFVVLRALPDRIEDARWLTCDQKAELARRIESDGGKHELVSWPGVFRDPQTLLLALQYFCLGLGGQIFVYWLPQMIHSMGFGVKWSGLLSATPWAAAAILTPLWAMHSTRTDERYWHAIIPCLAAAATFALGALFLDNALVTLGMISLGMAFSSMAGAAYWAIPRVLSSGAAAAAAIALTNSFGTLAGFIGPYGTGMVRDATGSFQLVLMLMALPLIVAALISAIAGRMADPTKPGPSVETVKA